MTTWHLQVQDTRLLRYDTSLGRTRLTVDCMRGEQRLGQGFRYQLGTVSAHTGIALTSLIGQPALLSAAGRDARALHGYITAAEPGLGRWHLTLEPWTAFLDRGRDSRVFQHMTVFDILDCVFAPWHGKGRLVPAWRFDIGARAAYPVRSLTTQDQESDLAFAERLISEEGLFHYFEHHGDPDNPVLGRHTMVIAEHDGRAAELQIASAESAA